MDFYESLNIFFTLLVLLLVIYGTYIYYTWPYSYFKNLGVTGPKPRPVFGTIPLDKSMVEADLHLHKTYGNIIGIYEGWRPVLFVHDPDIMKQAYIKDCEKFYDRRDQPFRGIFRHSIIDVKGEMWKRQRTHMSKYFSTGTMKMSMACMNQILDNVAAHLNEKCENNEIIDAKSVAAHLTMDIICRTAFGVQTDCVNNKNVEFATKAREVAKASGTATFLHFIWIFFPMLSTILNCFGLEHFDPSYIQNIINKIIAEKKSSNDTSPDFINTLLKDNEVEENMERTKGMTTEEISANATIILVAGFDTTSNTLTFLLYNLTLHEDCQERVYQEIQEIIGDENSNIKLTSRFLLPDINQSAMVKNLDATHLGFSPLQTGLYQVPSYDKLQQLDYLYMCIQESMRLYPLALRLERECTEATMLKDIPIKKGMIVQTSIMCLHKNPEIFPDPEKFDPERFSAENKKTWDPIHYMPFGIGHKHCIGQRLALLEVKLAAVRILQKFKLKRNEQTQVPIVTDPKSFLCVPRDEVWLSLEKRS